MQVPAFAQQLIHATVHGNLPPALVALLHAMHAQSAAREGPAVPDGTSVNLD